MSRKAQARKTAPGKKARRRVSRVMWGRILACRPAGLPVGGRDSLAGRGPAWRRGRGRGGGVAGARGLGGGCGGAGFWPVGRPAWLWGGGVGWGAGSLPVGEGDSVAA